MALGKDRVDWKGIERDQKAIDKLPNRGRASAARSKALAKGKESTKERHARYKKEDKFTEGMHEMNSRNHIQINN